MRLDRQVNTSFAYQFSSPPNHPPGHPTGRLHLLLFPPPLPIPCGLDSTHKPDPFSPLTFRHPSTVTCEIRHRSSDPSATCCQSSAIHQYLFDQLTKFTYEILIWQWPGIGRRRRRSPSSLPPLQSRIGHVVVSARGAASPPPLRNSIKGFPGHFSKILNWIELNFYANLIFWNK